MGQTTNMKKNGMKVQRHNAPQNIWADIYHDLMLLSWPKFVIGFFTLFVLINGFFAFLYYLEPFSISTLKHDFLSCLFFSVQTFSTVGYGYLAPLTPYSGAISSLEAFIGLMTTALMTGLAFAKFSRPKSSILFAEKILITEVNNKKTLMARMANIRNNRIMNAEFTLTLLVSEKTAEGLTLRRLHDLKLARSRTPAFALGFLSMHEIEKGSPLDQLNKDNIKNSDLEIIISIIGLDDTYGQTVHADKMYYASDIHFGGKFKDVLTRLDDGTRVMDFANFHAIGD